MGSFPQTVLTPSPGLALKVRLTVRMRQALRILQMPMAELRRFLEEEIVANPFLEETERDFIPAEREREQDEEDPAKEVSAQKGTSLHDHLFSQWSLLRLPDLDRFIGAAILEDLDENGYLISSLSSIARDCGAEVPQAERALALVQSLEPAGVGCRNLGECLSIQVCRLDMEDGRKELMKRIVTGHMDDLMKMAWTRMASALKAPPEDVQAAVAAIRRLNPRPGRSFGPFVANYVVPDVVFRRSGGGYKALCNKKELPGLKLRSSYRKLLRDPQASPEVRRYLKERLNAALLLLRAIQKRGNTLERVAKCLAEEQADFLRKGVSCLKPFQMAELARRLGFHKSTISRAVADKYAETPRGIVALRAFFDNSTVVKNKIRSLIERESLRNPVSDREMALLLKRHGINIARRTVAKHRQALRLPASSRKA